MWLYMRAAPQPFRDAHGGDRGEQIYIWDLSFIFYGMAAINFCSPINGILGSGKGNSSCSFCGNQTYMILLLISDNKDFLFQLYLYFPLIDKSKDLKMNFFILFRMKYIQMLQFEIAVI